MRSRSEKIPTSLPLCSAGTAPMLCSTVTCAVSSTVCPFPHYRETRFRATECFSSFFGASSPAKTM
jgi:hypothetical protein